MSTNKKQATLDNFLVQPSKKLDEQENIPPNPKEKEDELGNTQSHRIPSEPTTPPIEVATAPSEPPTPPTTPNKVESSQVDQGKATFFSPGDGDIWNAKAVCLLIQKILSVSMHSLFLCILRNGKLIIV